MGPETIPLEWQKYKLGEKIISEKIKAGGTPLKNISEYWKNGTIPFVKIEDMTNSQKYLYRTKDKITEKGLNNSSAWIVSEASILYSMYASYGEAVINKIPVSTNQAIIAIKPSKHVELEYLYYYLYNLKSTIHKYIRETTQKNLNAEIVRNFGFLLPPLVEQRGIAKVLGTVDEAIRRTDVVIEKAEELKRGLMQRLLTRGIRHTEFKQTELGEIPKTWENTRIGKVSEKYVDIKNSLSKKYVGIENIESNTGNVINFENEEIYSTKKYFPKNILLYSRIRAYLNKVWISTEDGYCSTDIILINPIKVKIEYLKYHMLSKKFVDYAVNYSSGTKMPRVSWDSISNYIFPIPPYNEQEKICAILENMDKKISLEKEKKNSLIKNKEGLMQVLLSGKIRVELREDGLHRISDG